MGSAVSFAETPTAALVATWQACGVLFGGAEVVIGFQREACTIAFVAVAVRADGVRGLLLVLPLTSFDFVAVRGSELLAVGTF